MKKREMEPIDLRSDTVTRPTDAMRRAMAEAPVGDDVYGEDPTMNHLETLAADMLGKEAALFATSGTQGNLLGILTHCGRGDEYIVGQEAHTYKFEAGGAAVLGSVQPQPLDFEPDGTLDLTRVAAAIKPADVHFARTRLLCLENTQGGKILPLAYLDQAEALARQNGLSLHLDGARIFNASVGLQVPVTRIADHFDTVSVCLSKGLGAPVGALLCGSREAIKEARKWRKMLGGGMRQAGILAAAGIVALTDHVERLAEDHANARRLAEGLARIEEVPVDPASVQTNMVFFRLEPNTSQDLIAFCKSCGVLLGGRGGFRLVTHLDVSAADIDRVIGCVADFFSKSGHCGRAA